MGTVCAGVNGRTIMRACILLIAILLLHVPSAYAVGNNTTPSERKDPPASQFRRVPMEFYSSGIKKHGRWIHVDGLGRLYIAPSFPPPYPRCTIESSQGTRCYEEVPR